MTSAFCQGLCESIGILRVGSAKVRDGTFDDVFAANSREARSDVRDESLFLRVGHQAVEISGLNEVVVIAMTLGRMISGEPGDFNWRPSGSLVCCGPPKLLGS